MVNNTSLNIFKSVIITIGATTGRVTVLACQTLVSVLRRRSPVSNILSVRVYAIHLAEDNTQNKSWTDSIE